VTSQGVDLACPVILRRRSDQGQGAVSVDLDAEFRYLVPVFIEETRADRCVDWASVCWRRAASNQAWSAIGP
jgi:hypothetical protein